MLATEPVVWGYSTDSFAEVGTAAANAGINITAGASDTDGTAVAVLGALAYDVSWIQILMGGFNTNAADGQVALDVLYDPAGGTSWSVLIADLVCGFTAVPSAANGGLSCIYQFPLRIPAGASLGAQAKTAHTADITSGRVAMHVKGLPSVPVWAGSRVETLGISDSRGTALTAGASSTWGSWTNVGSTLGQRTRALQFGLNGTDGTGATAAFLAQVGYGSTKVPGSHTIHKSISSNESGANSGSAEIGCDIASATQMQMRVMGQAASPETIYGAIYAVQ